MAISLKQQKQNEKITQQSQAWSDIARKIAHEIKNPLTPIQLSAERIAYIIKKENLTNINININKYINNILKYTKHIKNIVSNFANFTKISRTKLELIEINSLIKEMIHSREILNNEIKYEFHTNCRDIIVACDKTQMRQILVNLIQNSEEELMTHNNHNSKIAISTNISEDNGNLTITIIDNGRGFANDIIELAHKAYVTNKKDGNGLGLAIVERIVEEHFGRMIIANQLKGGAQITILLDTFALNSKYNDKN